MKIEEEYPTREGETGREISVVSPPREEKRLPLPSLHPFNLWYLTPYQLHLDHEKLSEYTRVIIDVIRRASDLYGGIPR